MKSESGYNIVDEGARATAIVGKIRAVKIQKIDDAGTRVTTVLVDKAQTRENLTASELRTGG